ncbi:MAG: DUF5110 domain-containing protein [Clostridia bacterium]|nr:DUF5110 domain-containing protein [Clostridia bacterium]
MGKNDFRFARGERELRVRFLSDRIVRVTYGEAGEEREPSAAVTAAYTGTTAVGRREEDGETVLFSDKLSVRTGEKGAAFFAPDGALLSRVGSFSLEPFDLTRAEGGRIVSRQTVDGVRASREDGEEAFLRRSHHGRLTFSFTEEETLFGLGSHEEGYDSLKGRYVPLYQENMRIAVPVFVSTKGYGVLIDCASFMTFDATDPRRGRFTLESTDAVDFYFLYGGDYDGVCRELRFLTGETPMLPKWAAGYIQSKERYATEEELIEIGKKYRELGIPIDALVQDWMYWEEGFWGNKRFDAARYPDPAGMTRALHDMDLYLMISIWPSHSGDSRDQLDLREKGFMLGDGGTYNAFDKAARDLYWKQAYEGLFQYGIDGWWCDSSEPYDAVWGGEERLPFEERLRKSLGEFYKYLDPDVINMYSFWHSRGMYENQRACSEKRVVNLTRSGFAGQHRFGTVVWSGDVSANWETLRKQVRILQNYVASGEAYWNSDIGAFFVKGGFEWFRDGDYPAGCGDPGYRELYARWLQFAAFTPMMRSHGTDTPREVWRFGERGTTWRDAVEKAIRLRYALLPFFYSVHAAVTREGRMPVAPLALAYPRDREAAKATGEYLYGRELLVCPVTEPGASRAAVYLPEGGWYDFETEEFYPGGGTVSVPVVPDRIPLFVRAGALIPVAPPVMSTGELAGKTYELRVYKGADGLFTLYDDAGFDYGYEKGDFTAVTYRYSEKEGTISETLEGKPDWKHPVAVRFIG